MDRGIYTPLSTQDDVFEIRLLRVLPSLNSDAMICCSLITYRLHPDERPHLYDVSSKPIRKGDLVCLLQGAPEATVVRPCEDFFQILAIQVPLQHMLRNSRNNWPKCLRTQYNLYLLWDWEISVQRLHSGVQNQSLVGRLGEGPEMSQQNNPSEKSVRIFKIAEILFESRRWGYSHLTWWKWCEGDEETCECLQTMLHNYRGLLQLDTAGTLGLMWKLLVFYAQANKKDSVLDTISQAFKYVAPPRKGTYGRF